MSFALEPILGLLQRRAKYQSYANLEWITNATLQIHRLAHENACDGESIWSHCVDTIPTASAELILAPLDIGKIDHPRLAKSSGVTSPTPSAHASLLDGSERPQSARAGLPPEPGASSESSGPLPSSNSATRPASPSEMSRVVETPHPLESPSLSEDCQQADNEAPSSNLKNHSADDSSPGSHAEHVGVAVA